MPIIMKKKYSISGNYTEEEKDIMQTLIESFRLSINDEDPEKNILNKKAVMYSDDKIARLLKRAMQDINSGQPVTKYNIFEFSREHDQSLLVDGAIVFALISEGLLQLRNQVNFNDSGLSIGLFDKTQLYQSWAGMLLQNYAAAKADFKSSIIPKMQPSMFIGIGSEFAYNYPWGY